MQSAPDSEIWSYAKSGGFTVVSKDEDFIQLANQQSDSVPVVWVRSGNCRTVVLLEAFDHLIGRIKSEFESGAKVVEIR